MSSVESPLSERVEIVLVNPLHPGNVGAVARAMANMGLSRLTLVDPPCLDMERARWMASTGGRVILANARFVGSVTEAVAECSLAVGATARKRRWNWPSYDPHSLAVKTFEQPGRTAVLFGREDSGLENEALAMCQGLLHIPTAGEPSLNLSQAVLLVASRMFDQARAQGFRPPDDSRQGKRSGGAPVPAGRPSPRSPAPLGMQQHAIQEAVALLGQTAYMRGRNPEQMQVTLGEFLQRMGPSRVELEILLGMLKKTRWAIDHPPDEEPS